MHIIFVGDINIASPIRISTSSSNLSIFKRKNSQLFTIANLEGAIFDNSTNPQYYSQALNNSVDVVPFLEKFNINAVNLANNHVFDTPIPISNTIRMLEKADIQSFGTGDNLSDANQPLVIKAECTTVKIFAFGWDVIGCHPAKKKQRGVNPLQPKHL